MNYINDDIIVFYTKKNGVNNFGDILENINYFNNLFAKETNHTSKKFDIWHFIPSDITSTLTNFAYIIVDYICKKLNYDYKNEFEREIYAAIIGVIMFFTIIFILLYLSHSSIIKY